GNAPNQGNHISSEHGHIETYKGPLLGTAIYGMNKLSANFSSDFGKIPLYVEQLKKIFESGDAVIDNYEKIVKINNEENRPKIQVVDADSIEFTTVTHNDTSYFQATDEKAATNGIIGKLYKRSRKKNK
ncbi:MAG: hypothetical protein ABIP51_02225, partial [Bacteroidia bacterium]